jgi:predicted N-acetyltransferase YhbS
MTTPTELLGSSAAGAIADLCARALARPPSADEVRGTLFTAAEPTIVRGDPTVGVVAAVPGPAGGSIRLLAVDPAHQGQGHGGRLLAAAESDLSAREGPCTITVGADPSYFLFPGVETSQTSMLCLLERRRYQRQEANFNMDVVLADIPGDPGGPVVAGIGDRDEVEAWLRANWDNWRPEALRALDKGTLLIDRDERGISGFCAYDVNRRDLVGPVAVRLDLMGKGAGVALLLGALHRLRAAGRAVVEVCWVGPIIPYARVGATVGRVFFVYRKQVRT